MTVISAVLLAGIGTTWSRGLLATAAVLTGQLSIGWSNDWLDAYRDAAVRRFDKPVVSGAVTARDAAFRRVGRGGRMRGAVVRDGAAARPGPRRGRGRGLGVQRAAQGLGVVVAAVRGVLRAAPGVPGADLAGSPGPGGRGRSAARRSSGRVRTWRTCCRTSRTTPPRGCAVCRTGSGGGPPASSRRCCSSAASPSRCSGRCTRRGAFPRSVSSARARWPRCSRWMPGPWR